MLTCPVNNKLKKQIFRLLHVMLLRLDFFFNLPNVYFCCCSIFGYIPGVCAIELHYLIGYQIMKEISLVLDTEALTRSGYPVLDEIAIFRPF